MATTAATIRLIRISAATQRGYHWNLTSLKTTASVLPVTTHTRGRSNSFSSLTGIATFAMALLQRSGGGPLPQLRRGSNRRAMERLGGAVLQRPEHALVALLRGGALGPL